MDIKDDVGLESSAEDFFERQISRQQFTKLVGAGVAGVTVAGALAPFAGAAGRLSGAGGAATKGKTFKIGMQTFEAPGYNAVIKLYKKTPGADDAKLAAISANVYQTLMPRLLAAGTAADVLELAPGGGSPISIETLSKSKYLMDLSDQPWVKKIPKSLLPVCSVNGKVHLAPVTGGVMVVFYNKSLFQSVGVTEPTTWPEFLAVCKKLKAAGKIPIWMDASNAYIGGVYPLFLTYPLSASTDAGTPEWPAKHKAGKVSFSKSGWVTALQNFMQLYDSEYFSPNATGGAPLSQLANNEAAMFCFVSQGIPTVKTAFGAGNVGAFVLPNATTASKVIASSGSGYGLAINAKTKNPAGAKAFLNTVTSPLGQKVYNALLGGVPLLPSRPGAVPQAFAPSVVPILRAGRTASYYDQLWPNSAVQKALIVGTQALMTGQKSIADVLGDMDAAYNQK